MEEIGFHQPENQFPPAIISSVFKNWFSLISVTISVSRKKLSSKLDVFYQKENTPIPGTNDSFKKTFSINGQKLSLEGVSKKIYKNGLYQPENPFPIPGMTYSLENTFSLGKTPSSKKKIEENGFFQQENVFLSRLVYPLMICNSIKQP